MIDQTEVQDFREKILAFNKTTSLQTLETKFCCAENVSLLVKVYSETVGNSRYSLPNGKYDPAYMRSRLLCYLIVFANNENDDRISYQDEVYLPHLVIENNADNDVVHALDTLLTTFLLPKLVELDLPISKDSWHVQ